ncbi:MAG: 16S rRNA (guanine(527)-N(7))-methyltransferase RsmG [Firmicutes bacterium HGW-Firmicutes-16]|nr:MAG: 16S rRNA (guanine(527)-N(7))-methyltransferase RsmG [Firmicutes bacterium HGW-Firmicutes-16]
MQQILKDGFEALGLPFTEEMSERFQKYYDYLTEKNAVMNLTAIEGVEATARLHFLDCAALCSVFDFSNASVIDVGTGAGFPGLPLKVAEPSISLTLLDSHKKRMDFLEETCLRLGLSDVRCICERAEETVDDIGGSYEVVVSRAVARLNILCELCMPFVHVGGVFIAMKGPDCEEELKEATRAIAILGGKTPEIKKYTIPGIDIVHSAVIIKKIKPTPTEYPRQFGRIKKAPL